MRKHILLLFMLAIFMRALAWGQASSSLSLTEAYSLLEQQYPNLQNSELLMKIQEQELEKVDISRLPGIFLKADGRLQSENIQLDAGDTPLPFEINRPLYSLNSYLEVNYLILDGGAAKAKRLLTKAHTKAGLQGIEVEKYSLRSRINQLFLGISLLRAQEEVFDYSLKDLESRKQQVAAGVELGTVLESELKKIEVKELELQARKGQLESQLEGMIGSLSYMIGKDLATDVTFEFPELGQLNQPPSLQRPEQTLFKLQREAIFAQNELVAAQRRPKLSAFAQGGVGYPNPLNLLENNIAPYGLVGAQFSWQIVDWKKSKVDKEILRLNAQKLNHAEQNFEFNMMAMEQSYLADVKRLQKQLEQDDKIAGLQAEILTQMAAQLDEGTITSADYLSQVNAELLARQNLLIHQTQLLQVQLNYWNEMGAF